MNLLVASGSIGQEHRPLLERIKALGYDGVEVPVFDGSVESYAALGRQLAEVGLAATVVTIVPDEANPISPDPGVRARGKERLAWAVECTATLGGTVMAGPFHSPVGSFTGAGPTEDERQWAAEALHGAAELGRQHGVQLTPEALNRFECYIMSTMDLGADLVRRVDHPSCRLMYDTFHANIEEQDPVAAFTRHADLVTHIHISENDRGIPGRGHVPWTETFAAIRASGYDGWLTVEAFGRALPALAGATRVWRDLFPDQDTLLVESIRMIRRHWEAAAQAD